MIQLHQLILTKYVGSNIFLDDSQEEEYYANNPGEHRQHEQVENSSDVQIIETKTPNPEASTKDGKGTKGTGSEKGTGAQNRKRGRPPKKLVVNTPPTVADEFSSESIAKRVQRAKHPGKQQTSPFRPFQN